MKRQIKAPIPLCIWIHQPAKQRKQPITKWLIQKTVLLLNFFINLALAAAPPVRANASNPDICEDVNTIYYSPLLAVSNI